MRFRRARTAPPTRISQADTVVQDEPAGQVIEEEEVGPPPPPPRPPWFEPIWPWLLLLLLLVIGGLIAAWLLTRDDDNNKSGKAAVVVPDVVGDTQNDAVTQLNQRELVARISTKASKLPAGTVFAEDPSAGTHVTRGSAVTLSISAAQQVVVPNVVGKRAAAAVALLRKRGLAIQTAPVTSSKPNGLVVSQSPNAGASVAKGSTEVIRISRGLVRVPNVVGQSRANAVAVLRGAKLVPSITRVPSSQPKGTVVGQAPPAGTRVQQGTKIGLNVSTGASGGGGGPPPPAPVPAGKKVPNVIGLSQAAAQRRLNAAGFKVELSYASSDRPPETVVGQSPQAGSSAPAGTRVKLSASLGSTPGAQEPVPRVAGLSPQEATSRLQAAGFKVQRLTQKVTTSRQNGVVVDVQPAGGSSVPSGTTVTIYVGRLG